MKSILVPTDFSECSAAAYSYASLLAEKTNATIYLLHILDISIPSISLGGEEETTQDTPFMIELMKATRARMQKTRARGEFSNVNVQEIIEVGSISTGVLKAADKYKIDMIIMGTHGANGLQEKFIGANAERIVRNAEIPVLSVKHAVKVPKIEAIIFATDFSAETTEVLPVISDIAWLFQAKLNLVKVITPADFQSSVETDKQIAAFRAQHQAHDYSTCVYYAATKEEGILYGAKATAADIIALGTHGRHGLAHFFRGSVAEDVVSHASLPVLTLNFHRKQINSQAVQEKANRQYESDFLYQIPSV